GRPRRPAPARTRAAAARAGRRPVGARLPRHRPALGRPLPAAGAVRAAPPADTRSEGRVSADWYRFTGPGRPRGWEAPPAPPWRTFTGAPLPPRDPFGWAGLQAGELQRARAYQADPREVELVNVAMFLRRPLLITGKPGTGKSTLAYAIAHEL